MFLELREADLTDIENTELLPKFEIDIEIIEEEVYRTL